MKIYIRYKVLEINPKDKIMSIKNQVEKLFKIPDYCQIFYYNNKRLYDDYSFSDYNIKTYSTLELLNLNYIELILNIQNLLGETLIYLRGSDTREDIKKTINEIYKIPPNVQEIFIDSKPIENDTFLKNLINLDNYPIKARLELKFSSEMKIKIQVNSKVMEVDLLKPVKIIAEQFNKKVYYKNNLLVENTLLIQHGIEESDYIELEEGRRELYIFTLTGKIFGIDAVQSDTIERVKILIEDREGIPFVGKAGKLMNKAFEGVRNKQKGPGGPG